MTLEVGHDHAWIIRATDSGMQTQVMSRAGAGVGWSIRLDVSQIQTLDEMIALFRSQPRDDTPPTQSMKAGQLFTFLRRISVGDYVLTPIKATRTVRIGTIRSDYRYDPQLFGPDHPHTRGVNWLRDVSRNVLSSGLIGKLNQRPTIISVDEFMSEIGRVVGA